MNAKLCLMISKLKVRKEKLDHMCRNYYNVNFAEEIVMLTNDIITKKRAFCGSTDYSSKWNCGTPKCSNCSQNYHTRAKQCIFHSYNAELKPLIRRSERSLRSKPTTESLKN